MFPFDPNAMLLDLRAAVRETWLLTAPGIRAVPGRLQRTLRDLRNRSERRARATAHKPRLISRWGALRGIRDDAPLSSSHST